MTQILKKLSSILLLLLLLLLVVTVSSQNQLIEKLNSNKVKIIKKCTHSLKLFL